MISRGPFQSLWSCNPVILWTKKQAKLTIAMYFFCNWLFSCKLGMESCQILVVAFHASIVQVISVVIRQWSYQTHISTYNCMCTFRTSLTTACVCASVEGFKLTHWKKRKCRTGTCICCYKSLWSCSLLWCFVNFYRACLTPGAGGWQNRRNAYIEAI